MALTALQHTLVARTMRRLKLPLDPMSCWNWEGGVTGEGYGRVTYKRQEYSTHRLMFEVCRGPIVQVLDHLCRNRRCCNPTHLEDVSLSENTKRGMSPTMVLARSGKCKKGHDLVRKDYQPQRRCLQCHARRERERKLRIVANITSGPQNEAGQEERKAAA